MARILYVGPDQGTSAHRRDALIRIGHDVSTIDPFGALARLPRLTSWGFKTGYLGLERAIANHVLTAIGESRFDIIWVDNGEQIGPKLVTRFKQRARFVLNHNQDNPFTARDGRRWRLFRKALPHYDLFATPRQTTRRSAEAFGARRVVTVPLAADEQVHRRAILSDAEMLEYGSEVAFIGTWMPERGPFLKRLVERGVPLRILGPRWDKAPEFHELAPIVSNRTFSDAEYVKAVSGTKIALGLLSLGNEDLHTTRSMEIPAIGTLLCATRTSDHEGLYIDGEEAVFFSTVDECADACLALLADQGRRRRISEAGHRRALRNNWFNERVCRDILAALPH